MLCKALQLAPSAKYVLRGNTRGPCLCIAVPFTTSCPVYAEKQMQSNPQFLPFSSSLLQTYSPTPKNSHLEPASIRVQQLMPRTWKAEPKALHRDHQLPQNSKRRCDKGTHTAPTLLRLIPTVCACPARPALPPPHHPHSQTWHSNSCK
jgi:hypothetical protein